ncbi:hypothetical protein HYV44_01960 [Candidatus Microgenomates bacterium]|nr:hypothetical protein [Candidatus Microgenomates bacterium]
MEEEMKDVAPACSACGGVTAGCKCEACGLDAEGSSCGCECGATSCKPKCASCGEADSKCACQRIEAEAPAPEAAPAM